MIYENNKTKMINTVWNGSVLRGHRRAPLRNFFKPQILNILTMGVSKCFYRIFTNRDQT